MSSGKDKGYTVGDYQLTKKLRTIINISASMLLHFQQFIPLFLQLTPF
jgi:hypothetical protein